MTEPKITKGEMESIFAPNYPRYQASFFTGENGGKDNQLVIRNEDKKEFETDLAWAKELIDKAREKRQKEEAAGLAELKKALATPAVKPVPQTTQEAPEAPQEAPGAGLALVCPAHKVKLVRKQGVGPKGAYDFWGCPTYKETGCKHTWSPPKDSINKEQK